MIDALRHTPIEEIEEAVASLVKDSLTREEQLARSALLVSYEQRLGADTCEFLMDRLGI